MPDLQPSRPAGEKRRVLVFGKSKIRTAFPAHSPRRNKLALAPRFIFPAIASKARHERSSDVRAEGYVCDMRVEFVAPSARQGAEVLTKLNVLLDG
jgi:hypothetical protein